MMKNQYVAAAILSLAVLCFLLIGVLPAMAAEPMGEKGTMMKESTMGSGGAMEPQGKMMDKEKAMMKPDDEMKKEKMMDFSDMKKKENEMMQKEKMMDSDGMMKRDVMK